MNASAWFAGAVETACSAALGLDPEVRARLGALDGKVIALELLGPGLRLYFFPHAHGVQVLGHYDGEPDTTLRGAPLALLRLGLSDKPADELFAGGVELRGDTATGQAFQDILRALRIDWEELLSRMTGDDIAHRTGRAVRAAGAQGRRAADTLAADLSEYLHEEAGVLATRPELEAFLQAVDGLRSDADRLEARLRRLEARLKDRRA